MKTIDIKENTTLYIKPADSENIIYNIMNDIKLVVFDYNIDTSKNVEINLNTEYSEVEYHYSSKNTNNNSFKIRINHNKPNTCSNVFNHIINIDNNDFILDVSSKVNKDCYKCTCNQDNQIINLNNGKGKILPNLLIDNYDVQSSHSAYIGEFKKENLYYLMSRGISEKRSINLLMENFLINNGNKDELIVKEFVGDNNG